MALSDYASDGRLSEPYVRYGDKAQSILFRTILRYRNRVVKASLTIKPRGIAYRKVGTTSFLTSLRSLGHFGFYRYELHGGLPAWVHAYGKLKEQASHGFRPRSPFRHKSSSDRGSCLTWIQEGKV